jgi:hypothetical protein
MFVVAIHFLVFVAAISNPLPATSEQSATHCVVSSSENPCCALRGSKDSLIYIGSVFGEGTSYRKESLTALYGDGFCV